MKPTIALIGRPNVGKSTLFNRLTKSQSAIVMDEPGITRDRQIGEGRVGDRPYWVVDTGGFEANATDMVDQQRIQQTLRAVDEANAVIVLLDAKTGLTIQDQVLSEQLRTSHARVFLVVNKAEGMSQALATAEFHELGLGQPYAISATHGDYVSDLMELILENFPPVETVTSASKHPILAIIGRPNTGKSTLLNRIVGENRVITCDEPGTTRDSIFVDVTYHDHHYTLIDTAGIRRKGRIVQTVEKCSIFRTLRAMDTAHVALLMLDAREGIADQDCAIANLALQAGCALVIAVNKWDGMDTYQQQVIKRSIAQKLAFLNFVRLHYISALHGSGINAIFQSIDEAYLAATIKFSTPKLTKILMNAVALQAPARTGNIVPKPRYAHQGGNMPPTIIIHGNALHRLSKHYMRFLEHRFRQAFKLMGTPLRVQYKSGRNPYHKAAKH
ncbi:MAG: ribosome biogenesis GTPase Der [Neisseriales bacterium]|nr:MAG: ribosome biogenesis GTPase Der [Neisseriales bacterium]